MHKCCNLIYFQKRGGRWAKDVCSKGFDYWYWCQHKNPKGWIELICCQLDLYCKAHYCSNGCRMMPRNTNYLICCPSNACNCKCGIVKKSFQGLFSLVDLQNTYSCKKCKGCFSGASSIKLKSGRSIAMSELQVGDHVETGLLKNYVFGIFFPNNSISNSR